MHKPDLVKPSKGIEECVVVNSLGSVELVEESVVDELQAQSLCSTHVCDWLARNQDAVPTRWDRVLVVQALSKEEQRM
jgi:hypothetical protein